MNEEDWNSPESRFLAYILAANEDGKEPLFVVFNAAENGVEFTLPAWANIAGWSRVLDTAANSVLGGRKKRSTGVKANRLARIDPGLRGQSMIEANPFGPLITPGERHLPALGSGRPTRRADASADARDEALR